MNCTHRPDTSTGVNTVTTPRATVTWKLLTDAEPKLLRLEQQTVWMAKHADTAFCANEVWYGYLKPQLVPLVGWSRGRLPECAQDGPRPLFVNLSDLKPSPRVPATSRVERLLRSCAAYDLAYGPPVRPAAGLPAR